MCMKWYEISSECRGTTVCGENIVVIDYLHCIRTLLKNISFLAIMNIDIEDST